MQLARCPGDRPPCKRGGRKTDVSGLSKGNKVQIPWPSSASCVRPGGLVPLAAGDCSRSGLASWKSKRAATRDEAGRRRPKPWEELPFLLHSNCALAKRRGLRGVGLHGPAPLFPPTCASAKARAWNRITRREAGVAGKACALRACPVRFGRSLKISALKLDVPLPAWLGGEVSARLGVPITASGLQGE